MIEQKDIDRLLAGRKIVDAYRSVAVSYREVAELSSKSEATTADKVARIEKYADREAAIKTMQSELYKLGFGEAPDNSAFAAFIKFNEQIIIEEYTEMVTLTFAGCDKCPTRKCIELYGAGACGNQNIKDVASVEKSMRLFFISLIKKSKDGLGKNFSDVKVCPDGYGFHWKRNRDERFNLGWE